MSTVFLAYSSMNDVWQRVHAFPLLLVVVVVGRGVGDHDMPYTGYGDVYVNCSGISLISTTFISRSLSILLFLVLLLMFEVDVVDEVEWCGGLLVTLVVEEEEEAVIISFLERSYERSFSVLRMDIDGHMDIRPRQETYKVQETQI